MRQARILLVEDDRDHQDLLRMSLGVGRDCESALSITIVSNRDEMIVAAKAGSYDCIVLDYNLPPFTAPELLSDLDRLQPGVPRILISSSEEQRIVIRAMRQGVADFVHKNDAIMSGSLRQSVDTAIRTSRVQRAERRKMNRRLRVLERHAYRDHLTTLLNRHGAELAISRSRSDTDRRGQIAVIFIDLDHFKRVNDVLGHCEGDRVLRDTAAVIKQHLSGADIAARWGGEEFIVLKQSETLAEAWIWGDRVRRAIAEEVVMPNGFRKQTASIGVDLVSSGELSLATVCGADSAMYLAKESGRDCVCTRSMTRAMDLAHELGSHHEMTVRERLHSLIQRMWLELGETQRDHTGPHGRWVQTLSHQIAAHLDECWGAIEELDLAAEFHDIGKVGIPDAILSAPRSLTLDERRLVREHARFGAELLSACGASELIANAVRRHHDRFDERESAGNTGVDLAAIISACDAAVTMLSDRPYTRRLEPSQMMCELKSAAGSQFHPRVVEAIEQHGMVCAEFERAGQQTTVSV